MIGMRAMDMLIKLYDLPPLEPWLRHLADERIEVRRAMAYEREGIVRWVRKAFGSGWSDECATAFGKCPVDCYIAVHTREVCGFCCLNTTFLDFIGPIGVSTAFRRRGVGRGLILAALHALRGQGYAYAVVGDVGEPEFFRAAVGAVEIQDSTPGAYPFRIEI
jgi:GNAT superfamily N-acetyltransferase